MLWSLKRAFCVGLSIAVCVLAFATVFAVRAVRLSVNAPDLVFVGREFYLYSPSSRATIKTELAWYEYAAVEGESVEYCILEGAGMDRIEFAREIFEKFGGLESFVEEVDGISCVYGFAPDLYGGIALNGAKVNLHVAVRGDRVVIGSPIIFGGF